MNDERYDLVITPHRQSVGYMRTKRQTLKKKLLTNQKQIIRKKFRIRNNRNTRISQFKRLNKQKPSN